MCLATHCDARGLMRHSSYRPSPPRYATGTGTPATTDIYSGPRRDVLVWRSGPQRRVLIGAVAHSAEPISATGHHATYLIAQRATAPLATRRVEALRRCQPVHQDHHVLDVAE